MRHNRLKKNAPGDFYTTGECLACGLPEPECPECLAPLTDENYDTYFTKQPETPKEIEAACSAALSCCVNAIRYGGSNPEIIKRLGNRPDYCDTLMAGGPVRFSWETEANWEEAKSQYREESRPRWKSFFS